MQCSVMQYMLACTHVMYWCLHVCTHVKFQFDACQHQGLYQRAIWAIVLGRGIYRLPRQFQFDACQHQGPYQRAIWAIDLDIFEVLVDFRWRDLRLLFWPAEGCNLLLLLAAVFGVSWGMRCHIGPRGLEQAWLRLRAFLTSPSDHRHPLWAFKLSHWGLETTPLRQSWRAELTAAHKQQQGALTCLGCNDFQNQGAIIDPKTARLFSKGHPQEGPPNSQKHSQIVLIIISARNLLYIKPKAFKRSPRTLFWKRNAPYDIHGHKCLKQPYDNCRNMMLSLFPDSMAETPSKEPQIYHASNLKDWMTHKRVYGPSVKPCVSCFGIPRAPRGSKYIVIKESCPTSQNKYCLWALIPRL